jgi:hypothetical protein
MRITIAAASILLLSSLMACRTALVETTIANRSGSELRVVQVDYPSASFGCEKIAAGADYHYRFRIQGSRPLKLSYNDTANHEHHFTGPTLYEGQRGPLLITIDGPDHASFVPQLTPR